MEWTKSGIKSELTEEPLSRSPGQDAAVAAPRLLVVAKDRLSVSTRFGRIFVTAFKYSHNANVETKINL